MKSKVLISFFVFTIVFRLYSRQLELRKEKPFNFHFRVYDSMTIRHNPTTQIAVTIEEWPDNTFLLWLPESITPEWNQWTPEIAHQDFTGTENGGLLWSYTKKNLVRISATLQPLRPESCLHCSCNKSFG